MVKLGSWAQAVQGNMNKRSQSKSRSNRSSGGGFIEDFRTEVGVDRRIVIPIFEDEDGNKGIFLETRAVHPIKKSRSVVIPTKSGKGFAPFAIGTSHPFKQPTFEKQLEIAKRGEVDLFTEFASLIQTDMWKKAEDLDNDKDTPEGRAEFKTFVENFDRENLYIEQAFYQSDGDFKDHEESYLLILELETVMEEEERRSGVTRPVARVVLQENGMPKYTPKFWKVSQKRLQAINSAVMNAIDNELIGEDDLYPYTEGDNVVETGWVEININFPHKTGDGAKMLSAQGATFSVVNINQSSVTKEFKEHFDENEADDLLAKAKREFDVSKRHLNAFPRAEQYEMLSDSAREYFDELVEKYPEESKRIHEQFEGWFETIKKQAGVEADGEDESKDSTESEVADTSEPTEKEETETEETVEEEEVEVNAENQSKLDELLGDI